MPSPDAHSRHRAGQTLPAIADPFPLASGRTFIAMDRKLLDLLVCPTTRQPLSLLDSRGLQALNDAIQAGGIARGDGGLQAEPIREALVTRDRKTVYRIDDGIPVLLAEEAIATAPIAAFPSA